jgi:hypothetical protein
MKTCWGNILHIGARWSWVVSRPGPFTPGEIANCTYWIGGWVGPRASLDAMEKRKILSFLGIEHRETSPSLYRLRYPVEYSKITHGGSFFLNFLNTRNDGKSRDVSCLIFKETTSIGYCITIPLCDDRCRLTSSSVGIIGRRGSYMLRERVFICSECHTRSFNNRHCFLQFPSAFNVQFLAQLYKK